MIVATKTLGSKKKLFADFSVPLPPNRSDEDGDGGMTLADVIEKVVRHEVQAFRQRQTDRQFIRALTATEIDNAIEKGKVVMGASEVGIQLIDEDQAVQAALVAFEDGLYLVAIDDELYKNLDQQVFLTDDSRLTFIRLTMLSGA